MKLLCLTEASINNQANNIATQIAQTLCTTVKSNKHKRWVSQQVYYKILNELNRLTLKHQYSNSNQTLIEFIITELSLFNQWLTIYNHFTTTELIKTQGAGINMSWDEAYATAIKSQDMDETLST